MNEGDVGHEILVNTLEFFENYTKEHFGDEEQCMHRYHCPIAKKNATAHTKFIEFFDECKKRLQTQEANEAFFRDLLAFCEQWLIEHICNIDVQLKPCVHQ